jgi:5-methylcytosine-specific restriction protein A
VTNKQSLAKQIDDIYFNSNQPGNDANELLTEGSRVQVWVNRYERDPKARKIAIQHHGTKCKVCGFDFGKHYGAHGEGYIQIHHKKMLSEIGREYEVDPLNDLVPLCANCHEMIHKDKEPLTIEQLKKLLKTNNT